MKLFFIEMSELHRIIRARDEEDAWRVLIEEERSHGLAMIELDPNGPAEIIYDDEVDG